MSVQNFDELMDHVGHRIVCTTYSQPNPPRTRDDVANVAVECETCSEVLLDFDREEDDDD